jgi:hypothetical protein
VGRADNPRVSEKDELEKGRGRLVSEKPAAPALGISAVRLEAYERLVAALPDVERKGASMPYTSRRGHMFSFLAADGTLALRLNVPDREAFVAEHGAVPHVAHGKPLAEYVAVPDPLIDDPVALSPWFVRSLAYVSSLKPKPTTKPKRGS